MDEPSKSPQPVEPMLTSHPIQQVAQLPEPVDVSSARPPGIHPGLRNRSARLRFKSSEHLLDFYELYLQDPDEAELRHAELIESLTVIVPASRRAFEQLISTLLQVGIVLFSFTVVSRLVNGLNVFFVISILALPVGAYCLSASYSALLLWRSTSRLSQALHRRSLEAARDIEEAREIELERAQDAARAQEASRALKAAANSLEENRTLERNSVASAQISWRVP